MCLLWGKGKFCVCWILILIFIFICRHVQSDSESDLSQAQRLNPTVASRVNCLMRPTISSQNKVTSSGGNKNLTNQNARRRGLTAAYSAGTKKVHFCVESDGFGGLVVSVLPSGTRVRGFRPGRSHRIFQASEKSSTCLPSEGGVKESVPYPSFAARKRTWYLRELRMC